MSVPESAHPEPPPPEPVFAVGVAGVLNEFVPAPPFGDAVPPQSPAAPAV